MKNNFTFAKFLALVSYLVLIGLSVAFLVPQIAGIGSVIKIIFTYIAVEIIGTAIYDFVNYILESMGDDSNE